MYLNTAALGLYFAVGKLLGHYDKVFDFLSMLPFFARDSTTASTEWSGCYLVSPPSR